jgi:hypothetical protein
MAEVEMRTERVDDSSLLMAHLQKMGLAGMYPGIPKQLTIPPTTDRLLAAFKEITLSSVILPDQTIIQLTPLSPVQIWILELLDFSPSNYSDLAVDILPNPP